MTRKNRKRVPVPPFFHSVAIQQIIAKETAEISIGPRMIMSREWGGVMEAALAELSRLLEIRLSKGIHTSEDDVRYAFFSALQSGLALTPDRIILEYPYKFKAKEKKIASELDV